MRKPLAEIRTIEQYLNKQLPVPRQLLFEAKMLLDPALRARVKLQKQLLAFIRQEGRAALKATLEQHFRQRCEDPVYYHQLTSIFK
jgi:hypothetical protein